MATAKAKKAKTAGENWATAVFQGSIYQMQTQIMNFLDGLTDPDSAKIATETFQGQAYSYVFYNLAGLSTKAKRNKVGARDLSGGGAGVGNG
jgi:hypothetical protein